MASAQLAAMDGSERLVGENQKTSGRAPLRE
jgi:hypothetical protein